MLSIHISSVSRIVITLRVFLTWYYCEYDAVVDRSKHDCPRSLQLRVSISAIIVNMQWKLY